MIKANTKRQFATRVVDRFPLIKPSALSLAMRRPLYGVGINDADYVAQPTVDGKMLRCPIYNAWKGMLERCYCPKFQAKRPTYVGCSVAKDWLLFSNFQRWALTQDWLNKQLDKDIIFASNKRYSPDTCLFVTIQVNSLLIDCYAARGDHPVGVHYRKDRGKFQAKLRINGKTKHIGLYPTPDLASDAYRKAKKAYIERVANEQTCNITRDGLLRHAALLTRD